MVDNIEIADPQEFWLNFFRNKDRNIKMKDLAYLGFETPEETGEQRLCAELGG